MHTRRFVVSVPRNRSLRVRLAFHVKFHVLFGSGNSTVHRMEETANDPRPTVISWFRRRLLCVTDRLVAR